MEKSRVSGSLSMMTGGRESSDTGATAGEDSNSLGTSENEGASDIDGSGIPFTDNDDRVSSDVITTVGR